MKATKRKPAKKSSTKPGPLPAVVVPSGNPRWELYVAGALAALAAAFAIYNPALHGPFVLDDLDLPYDKPGFSSLLRPWITGLRPALMFTFWLNRQSAGDGTYAYHAWNVILHVLGSGVIFLIARKLLEFVRTERFLRDTLAVFAAGVFLLHPLQTESVAYIASRSEVLSVLFFNAALAAFLYRRSTAISIPDTLAVLLLFAGAMLSKEHTAILPALLLLTDYFWNPGFSFQGIRRNWKLYAPILAGGLLGGIGIYRIIRHSPTAGFGVKEFSAWQYFLTECRVIWDYLRMFVLPFGQNVDPDVAVSRGLDVWGMLGLLALIAVTVAAWMRRRRYPLAAYGWFVWLLLLAPTSSFIPIRDVMAERRVYLPFLGLLLIVLELLRRWRSNRVMLIAALAGVLLVEGALTYSRSEVWRSSIALWQDSVSNSPHKWRPNFQLAKAYFDARSCPEAVSQYERTALLQAPDFSLLVDWAEALDCNRQYEPAIFKLQQAAALHPSAHIYAEIAKEYGFLNNFDQALGYLNKAQQINPNYDMTYVYRGMIYASRGDRQHAEAEYRHSLQLNPGNPVVPTLLQQLQSR